MHIFAASSPILPYALLSLIGILAACVVLIHRKAVAVAVVYLLLFLFALMSVTHIISVYIVGAVILLVVFLMDRRTLRKPDYALLLTLLFCLYLSAI